MQPWIHVQYYTQNDHPLHDHVERWNKATSDHGRLNTTASPFTSGCVGLLGTVSATRTSDQIVGRIMMIHAVPCI